MICFECIDDTLPTNLCVFTSLSMSISILWGLNTRFMLLRQNQEGLNSYETLYVVKYWSLTNCKLVCSFEIIFEFCTITDLFSHDDLLYPSVDPIAQNPSMFSSPPTVLLDSGLGFQDLTPCSRRSPGPPLSFLSVFALQK